MLFTLFNPRLGGGTARCSCTPDSRPPERSPKSVLRSLSRSPPPVPALASLAVPLPGRLGGDGGCFHGTKPWRRRTRRRGCSTPVPRPTCRDLPTRAGGRRRAQAEAGRGVPAPGPPHSPAGSAPGPAWAAPAVLPILLPARQVLLWLGNILPSHLGICGDEEPLSLALGVSPGSEGWAAPQSPHWAREWWKIRL